jgi:exopolysaccharide biosynthesis protein
MKQPRKITLTLVSLGIALLLIVQSLQAQPANNQIHYQTIERSQYTIHTVKILHNSNYVVIPDISGNLQLISAFAQDNVVAAINGGYFDPVNQKTTSFIVHQAKNIADPRFNERLVDNPDLKQYLNKIFNRAEFRRYQCNSETKYDIQLHSAPIPNNCTLVDSLGGGPGLLPQDTSVAEGFTAFKNGEKIRDAIGSESLNARSAVGISQDGDIILTMVAQQPEEPLNSGISLPELTKIMSNLGAVKAMNLDGGSSASLYYDGQVAYGRVDQEGNKIQRPIKSVLLVTK